MSNMYKSVRLFKYIVDNMDDNGLRRLYHCLKAVKYFWEESVETAHDTFNYDGDPMAIPYDDVLVYIEMLVDEMNDRAIMLYVHPSKD